MRVGSLGYATEQGIGYLMKDFYDNGVVDDVIVKRYPITARANHPEWYPGAPVVSGKDLPTQHHRTIRAWMDRIDVALFFESPLDWQLLKYARNLGKRTAIVTMYEWWPEQPPALPDLLICPSDLDYDVFNGAYHPYDRNTPIPVRLNVPAPSGTWRQRTGARRFLHNAGHVGSRNHKGTDTLLSACEYLTTPLHLTTRCQTPELLRSLTRNYFRGSGAATVEFVHGDVPRDRLFAEDHDVYVAPEKYNGLSLPLQEAFAAGMPVVTTDRYPANVWLPRETLIPVSGTQRVRVAPGHLEIDESVVDPRDVARVLDGLYGADITDLSLRGKAWAEANSWDVLRPKYRAALEALL